MKILTFFGTRPEIIRLSLIIGHLDSLAEHTLVHTGQNFHENLSEVFFRELAIRKPDLNLEIKGESLGEQLGVLLSRAEKVIDDIGPDRILLLGDTNSALVSIIAARRQIPVFHMEAGNRCFDDRVPEEINRRIIDHTSAILLPYTDRSKENLLREGIERDRIFITGNPIFEVLNAHRDQIDSSGALDRLQLERGGYFLATIHRAENVDKENVLRQIFNALGTIAVDHDRPVIVSVHPRTAAKLSEFGIETDPNSVRLIDALPFFDFVKLEKNAFMVLTDSGTVQEECSIFRVPNVTVRDVTERPETVECGSNVIGGTTSDSILMAVNVAANRSGTWSPPSGYEKLNVAETVCNIVSGHLSLRRHK
jgi:UDP-N-acetylglucosamine 2-epimerase (non-hydrolysing)